MAEPTSLLNLPVPVLVQCLPTLTRDLKPCLAVCTRVQQLLLNGPGARHASLHLRVKTPADLQPARATLQRAVRLVPGLARLYLELCKELPVDQQLAQLLASPAPGEDMPGLLGGPAWLPGITHIRLLPWDDTDEEGWAPQHQLVPGCLAIACPNLTHLHLHHVYLWPQPPPQQQQQQQQHLPQLQQLRQLTLDSGVSGLPAAVFQQQLQALPGLQHLDLDFTFSLLHFSDTPEGMAQVGVHGPQWQTDIMPVGWPWESYAAAIAAAASDRVTALTLRGYWPLSSPSLTALLASDWAQLRELGMDAAAIDDAVLRCIMQHLPQLQHLRVPDLELSANHSEAWRSWRLHMPYLDVVQLARLPSGVTLALANGPVHVQLADTGSAAKDMQLTAAAVQRVRDLQPYSNGGCCFTISLGLNAQPHMGQVLQASLPLLQHATQLQLQLHVTRALLSGISQHLPACRSLVFEEGCTFEQGIWRHLLSLLPHVASLCFSPGTATLVQLTIVCASATRCITLCGSNPDALDSFAGNEEQGVLRDDLRRMVLDLDTDLITIDWQDS